MEAGTVDFLQVNYSLLETAADRQVLPMAHGQGRLPSRSTAPSSMENISPACAVMNCLPGQRNSTVKSWAQFSLKFILSHPAVTCVLTETANPKHALDNIGAGFGRLPEREDSATHGAIPE